MTTITEIDVVHACQTLFGKEINVSKDFLYSYMQPSGVKSAYRRKAKENHPDFFAADPNHIQQKQTILFREILRAYDVLNLFFKQREDGAWKPSAKTFRARKEHTQKKGPASKTAGRNEETIFDGSVPSRTLLIGEYLYYRRKIPFGALIKALVWQRKQRPSFGEIALRWGWLKPEGHEKLCGLCSVPRRFGEKAVEHGLLTVFQVNVILLYQRSLQSQLGSYFVQNEFLNQYELESLAREHTQHNAAVLADSSAKARTQNAAACA